MDESLGSFKTLEQVYLKTTYDMEAGGREFKEGETVAVFDKIQVSGLQELKSYVAARGGFDNRGHVYWETTKEMQFNFSQGVFSSLQFGLMNNAKMIKIEEEEPILITRTEELESTSNGYITTTDMYVDQIFVYDKDTGEKLEWYPIGDRLKIDEGYKDVIVTYRYAYGGGAQVARIGERFMSGFLTLEGKTRVKDDTSGLVTTGIIKIPKLKLMSGLSMRLGKQANPVVGNFSAVGIPVGERNSSYVCELLFLNNDIDSDM